MRGGRGGKRGNGLRIRLLRTQRDKEGWDVVRNCGECVLRGRVRNKYEEKRKGRGKESEGKEMK